MPEAKKTTIFVVVAISGACCLGCVIAALFVLHYQPAVVAAPGHEMHWPTRPKLWASVMKSYQRFLEIRTRDYTVLG